MDPLASSLPLDLRIKLTFDDEDGLWYADCLDLQGCHTFGTTKEGALENITGVITDRLVANVERVRDDLRKMALRRRPGWAHRASTETLQIPA